MSAPFTTPLGARLEALQRANQADLIDNEEYRFLRKQAFIHLAHKLFPPLEIRGPSSPPTKRRAAGEYPAPESGRKPERSASWSFLETKQNGPTSFLHVPDGRGSNRVAGSHTGAERTPPVSFGGGDAEEKKIRRRSFTQWIGLSGDTSNASEPSAVEGKRVKDDGGGGGGNGNPLSRSTSSVFGNSGRSRSPSPGDVEGDRTGNSRRRPTGNQVRGSIPSRAEAGILPSKMLKHQPATTIKPDRKRSWISPSISAEPPRANPIDIPPPLPATRSARSDVGLSSKRPPSAFRGQTSPPRLTWKTTGPRGESAHKLKSESALPPPLTLERIQALTSVPLLRAERDRLLVEECELRRAYEEVEEGIWKVFGGQVRDAVGSGGGDAAASGTSLGQAHNVGTEAGASAGPVSRKKTMTRPGAEPERKGFLSRTRSRMFEVFRRSNDQGSSINTGAPGSSPSFWMEGGRKLTNGSDADLAQLKNQSGASDGVVLHGKGIRRSVVPIGDARNEDGRVGSDGLRRSRSAKPSSSMSAQSATPHPTRPPPPGPPTPSHRTSRPSSTNHPSSILSVGALFLLRAHEEQAAGHESLEKRMDKLEQIRGFRQELAGRYEERRSWVEVRIQAVELEQRARRS